ncbi:PREDICTED: RING finger protein 145-like [Nipponia nippon]|uniref:RING finger protein 145-like n=1 Tax=Nipponia nippon TaxID=128390 RepID=UPI000510BD71|nr:PREDICTED: RING finger protein 145-like [Nipponia nippon]
MPPATPAAAGLGLGGSPLAAASLQRGIRPDPLLGPSLCSWQRSGVRPAPRTQRPRSHAACRGRGTGRERDAEQMAAAGRQEGRAGLSPVPSTRQDGRGPAVTSPGTAAGPSEVPRQPPGHGRTIRQSGATARRIPTGSHQRRLRDPPSANSAPSQTRGEEKPPPPEPPAPLNARSRRSGCHGAGARRFPEKRAPTAVPEELCRRGCEGRSNLGNGLANIRADLLTRVLLLGPAPVLSFPRELHPRSRALGRPSLPEPRASPSRHEGLGDSPDTGTPRRHRRGGAGRGRTPEPTAGTGEVEPGGGDGRTGCHVAGALEVYRLVALGVSLWSQLAVPLLFLVFWLVLFSLRLSSFLASSGSPLAQQGLLFLLLSSAAECCSTPYSLVGLTFTVSYLALGVLNLCKFYLLGFGAFQNGNVMHRGVTEGVTLLLLALQTGLLDLQILQRTFLLSIILFIVVTSTLQSMIEIADPIVLALGASRNRSPWKHFRGVSMCLFLLVFPCFMAYKIAHFFHLDFWLLILVSSCMLTSLQVMGTLFIYALFMVELLQDTPLERMDEIIYCVNAVSRVLEFLVAVCVVGYGTWESLFGEWSWMGASVIIIHSYFNVWLRAQSGWRSFLLRREAAKKINSLPRATGGQLRDHNDVCAICFQDMQVAVVTPCSHFFHATCLRKWLYVQDTCPMCHQQVRPEPSWPQPSGGSG